MPPRTWDDESEESTPPSSPPAPVPRRSKFDDEEEEGSDVLESWDAAEDSEVEREKAKKAAETKAKEDAAKKANHKTKSQRIEERRMENMRKRQDESSEDDDEDESERRARLRKTEQESDLKHAQDLFGDIGISKNRSNAKAVTAQDPDNPDQSVNLAALPLFNPNTKDQFTKLRESLVPLLTANARKAQYTLFMQEFTKQIVRDLPSDQIKKIASGLTTLSNEKMKEEKQAEKGGKKSKAAKTKTSLVASRDTSMKADTNVYDDGLDDGDFM